MSKGVIVAYFLLAQLFIFPFEELLYTVIDRTFEIEIGKYSESVLSSSTALSYWVVKAAFSCICTVTGQICVSPLHVFKQEIVFICYENAHRFISLSY